MFLFLSGMLSNVYKTNFKNRFKKLIVPYCVWTAVYVLAVCYKNINTYPLKFVKSILTANSVAVMYYIFVYLELTFLIPIIDKLAKSKYKYLGFLITPIEILVMRTIPLIMEITFNKYILTLMSISCLGWFSYYYLGYLIGNEYIKAKYKNSKLIIYLIISIILQMLEGYAQYKFENKNCGTQLKLSSILTGTIFCLIAYNIIFSEKDYKCKILKKLGDNSFGIYFSHLLIMSFLNKIPFYNRIAIFPVNAIITIVITYFIVVLVKKLLGKKAWIFGC